MANSRYTAVRVGVLIAGGIALLAFAIMSIGSGTELFSRSYEFQVHFKFINGLTEGSPVTLSGVPVGAVKSIDFPTDPSVQYVAVTIRVYRAAAPRIHTDALAMIKSMGLLGDKYVDLTPGTAQAPAVQPGAVLPSQTPIDYEALLETKGGDQAISDAIEVVGQVHELLSRLNEGNGLLAQLIRDGGENGKPALTLGQIHDTLADVDKLSLELSTTIQRVNNGNGIAAAMLKDQPNGQQILQNLSDVAGSMRETTRKLDTLLDRVNNSHGVIGQMIDNQVYADQLLANLKQSTTDARDILAKINGGRGTAGLMVNDSTLYYNLTDFLGNNGAGGWGMSMLRGLYGVTHPFSPPLSGPNQCSGAPATMPTSQAPASGTLTQPQ